MKTGKPTENELEIAIVAAEQRLERGQDEHHVAAALLYLYQRQQELEIIRDAAEYLLLSAQDEDRQESLAETLNAARSNEAQRTARER